MSVVSQVRAPGAPRWAISLLVVILALTLVTPGIAVAQRTKAGPAGISQPTMADSVELAQGTTVGWSHDWTLDESRSGDTAVVLQSGDSTYSVAEQKGGDSLDAVWERRKASSIEAGGQPIDSGERLDEGFYGLWVSPQSGNYVVQAVGYAPRSADVILSVMLISPEAEIASILAENQVVINDFGVAWPTIDIDALMTTYAEGKPSGDPIFPAAPPRGQTPAKRGSSSAKDDGLVDDTSYVSPQFDYEVTWEGDWKTSTELVVSDPDEGYDQLTLSTASPGAGGLSIYGMLVDDALTIADYVEYWSSDEYLSEFHPEGTEAVLAESGRRMGAVVLVGPYDEGDPELWVTVMEVTVTADDVLVETTLATPLEGFEAVYEDAGASVMLDGDAVIGYFSVDEILDELP